MLKPSMPSCCCSRLQEIDELYKIFQVLGTPSEAVWPGVSHLPDFKVNLVLLEIHKCCVGLDLLDHLVQDCFPQWRPRDLQTVVPTLDPVGVDLLARLLCYNPSERITARAALEHPWFHH